MRSDMMEHHYSNPKDVRNSDVPVPASHLFGDLVLYLVEVLDRERTGHYRPYKYVEAFCECNNLNTNLVQNLLQKHGANNDIQVLSNCLNDISPYRELPQRTQPPLDVGNNTAVA